MKHVDYKTSGVCSKLISYDLDDENKVHNLKYVGGCHGNLKAIGLLVEGMDASKVISILEGNTCGYKGTSCADQLTKSLKEEI